MQLQNNPCRDCVAPKRHPGCHAECEAYLNWKKEWDAQKEKIREQQRMDSWALPEKPIRKRRH